MLGFYSMPSPGMTIEFSVVIIFKKKLTHLLKTLNSLCHGWCMVPFNHHPRAKGVRYNFLVTGAKEANTKLIPFCFLGPQLISTHFRCSSAVNQIPLRLPNKILYILIHMVKTVSDSFLRLFLQQESMGVSQLYDMDDKVSESR